MVLRRERAVKEGEQAELIQGGRRDKGKGKGEKGKRERGKAGRRAQRRTEGGRKERYTCDCGAHGSVSVVNDKFGGVRVLCLQGCRSSCMLLLLVDSNVFPDMEARLAVRLDLQKQSDQIFGDDRNMCDDYR